MKKNLIMITKVKNEADIIEYFLRYHSNIFDRIIVIDNGSLDGTYEIVKALIEEGLPIDLINEAYSDFDALRFANQYTKKFSERYKAKQVVLMDADEFLMAEDNSNPRIILEELSEEIVHYYYWKTYLYAKQKKCFSLDTYGEYRDEKGEKFTKIIVPGKIIQKAEILIEAGNHDCHLVNINSEELKKEYHNDLKFCHFPVRSLMQYKKQILLNTIDMISNPHVNNHTGSHWKEMLNDISIGNVDLKDISLHYAFYEGNDCYNGKITSYFPIVLKYEEIVETSLETILLKHAELQAMKLKILRNSYEKKERKKQIVIWGTGYLSEKMKQRIPEEYSVQVYVDNDKQKEFTLFDGKVVVTPEKIRFIQFDLIVIASEKYKNEIYAQIKDLMPYCDEKKIISLERMILDTYDIP